MPGISQLLEGCTVECHFYCVYIWWNIYVLRAGSKMKFQFLRNFLFSRKITLSQDNEPKLGSVYLLPNMTFLEWNIHFKVPNYLLKIRAGHASKFGSSRQIQIKYMDMDKISVISMVIHHWLTQEIFILTVELNFSLHLPQLPSQLIRDPPQSGNLESRCQTSWPAWGSSLEAMDYEITWQVVPNTWPKKCWVLGNPSVFI